MKTTIEIPECNWSEKFRVMGKLHGEEKILFSSDFYQAAVSFCWKCKPGPSELRIEKVWIPKTIPSYSEGQVSCGSGE